MMFFRMMFFLMSVDCFVNILTGIGDPRRVTL